MREEPAAQVEALLQAVLLERQGAPEAREGRLLLVLLFHFKRAQAARAELLEDSLLLGKAA